MPVDGIVMLALVYNGDNHCAVQNAKLGAEEPLLVVGVGDFDEG